jgi:hypothetical protein
LGQLGIAADRTIQLYREGNVLWQASGDINREKAAELRGRWGSTARSSPRAGH